MEDETLIVDVYTIESPAVIGAASSTEAIKEFVNNSAIEAYLGGDILPFELVSVFFCGDTGEEEDQGRYFCIHGKWELESTVSLDIRASDVKVTFHGEERSWDYV